LFGWGQGENGNGTWAGKNPKPWLNLRKGKRFVNPREGKRSRMRRSTNVTVRRNKRRFGKTVKEKWGRHVTKKETKNREELSATAQKSLGRAA